jgi:hypothetical protein
MSPFHFLKRGKRMSDNDTKAWKDEYVKGASIDEIALKYDASAAEVETAVVTPDEGAEELPAQSDFEETPVETKAEEPVPAKTKKGK